jgi:Protein of unknown function (DUF664)
MTPPVRRELTLPTGYASHEVALFVASLDDQLTLLTKDTRGMTPEELQWQSAPGMNTIGMLLAHLAVVELWWNDLVLADIVEPVGEPVLGIGVDDDGMPLPEGKSPPANLAGKTLEFYDDLLARARKHLVETVRGFKDGELDRSVTRTRANGVVQEITKRWTFYHILEHFSGHYGQILLIRHQYRLVHAAVDRSSGVV